MSQKQITEEARQSSQMRFPAIWLENGFLIVMEGPVRHANRLGLKKASHNKALIADVNGNRFRVAGVRKIRTLFSWRFGKILEFLSGNPDYEVEWSFDPVSKISVGEMKDLLFKALAKQQDLWEEMIDFDEFKAQIASANSFDQVFSVLRTFNFMS